MAYNFAGLVLVGAVVAWAKSFTNTPALPSEYVECNGQTLSDAQSVFNGQTIPNLNASGGGSQRFLRGSSTSGSTGGTETHTHTRGAHDPLGFIADDTDPALFPGCMTAMTTVNHLSSYYEVVWCVRIK